VTIPTTPDPDGLEGSIARLAEAVDAAATLGIPVDEARAAHGEAVTRLGFPSDVFVLALVGGTGVGKSTLLNALAGSSVSPASVRRPTTAQPVAWIPAASHQELAGLLAWLEVREVREHERDALRDVAILDLPDMDSVAAEHRARVEALLPKVDAVAWVTDPEKYHDAVLVDDFLRTWLPRLDRQAIVLNKADRLDPDDVQRVRRDLQRDLVGGMGGAGRTEVPVLATSATTGEAGIGEFSDWLAAGVEAKQIVRARLAATISSLGNGLARTAGIDPGGPERPFLDPSARRKATAAVTSAVLRAIDLPGLERQAVAATRARARARGTGPMGVITSLVYRFSGREAKVADPDGFLMRWRDRGSLAPAVEVLRQALGEPLRTAAPAVRPALAATVEPARLQRGLEGAVDRAIAGHDRTVPSSRLWPVIGFLQTIATVAIALSVAWTIVWVLARPPVDSVDVPVIGVVPMPFVAVVVSLFVGYLLARVVGLHAGWIGRRWAGRLRREIAASVEREIADRGFEPLDRLEAARQALWASARALKGGATDR